MNGPSPAQRLVLIAYAARAAELWADGHLEHADKWADAAFRMVGGREYIDLDEEADR